MSSNGLRSVPVVALALTPALLLRVAWPVLAGDARVIDDVLTISDESWVVAVGIWVSWIVAVLLGAAVLDGRPQPVLRALPVAFTCVAAFALALLTLFFVLPPSPLIFVGAGVLLFGFATALALVSVVAVVQECGFAAFSAVGALRGRWWRACVPFVIAVMASGFAVRLIMTGLPSGSPTAGLIAEVLRDLLLVGVAATQAWALAGLYRRTHPGPEADRPPTAWPARRWVALLGGLALLVPAVFVGGAVAVADVPRLITSPAVPSDTVVQVAWPAGHHPILVTRDSILDCVDDRCSDFTAFPHGVELSPHRASVIIRPDGSVLAFNRNTLLTCDAARKCENSAIARLLPATLTAMTVNPAGDLLIATASPLKDVSGTQLGVLHCRDPRCGTSDWAELGKRSPIQLLDEFNMRQLAIRVDPTGVPVVAFYNSAPVSFDWCVTSACAERRTGFPTEHGLSSQTVAALYRDLMRPCDSKCGDEFPGPAVAAPGGGVFAVEQHNRGPEGMIVQSGPGLSYIEADLLSCADFRCAEPWRRVRVSVERRGSSSSGWPGLLPQEFWLLAAGPDGQALLVRPKVDPLVVTIVTP
ncbi:hypothetical protein F4553_001341 [Allocatelliglobosispora scoriae]|uniref:Uncharacterized protein n=1 Tax=Allocatelliglobosispora scoriae TaxID=643052 RepID=A0A841BMH8_9ACTN|nr:hypothetical protein [Allocatelliglobosispora scoriae]MBB5867962.1 hypothetical protein [Allocatelliglobosispora scoriae]